MTLGRKKTPKTPKHDKIGRVVTKSRNKKYRLKKPFYKKSE